jgi:hypothetical protein
MTAACRWRPIVIVEIVTIAIWGTFASLEVAAERKLQLMLRRICAPNRNVKNKNAPSSDLRNKNAPSSDARNTRHLPEDKRIFAQPGSSPLDSLANDICPTNSQSDVTGFGGSSAPTLLPPKPNCKLPGAGFGEPFNHSQQTIHYTRWNGDDLPIPPGFGLWLQDGLLEVQQVDAAHPADIQPKGGATPDGCMPPAAYESGSAAATGWVSLGCQMGASGINCNGFVRTRFAKPTAFGTERLFIQTETQ